MEIGLWEIILIVIVAGMVFGVGKLPEIGKQLGRGVRDFKKYSAVEGDAKSAKAENKPLAQTEQGKPDSTISEASTQERFSKN